MTALVPPAPIRRSRAPGSAALVIVMLSPAWWPVRAAADCYFVYDEGFRATYQRASGMTLPRKAGHLSSMAECQATLHGVLSNPQYIGDAGLRRTVCECYGDEGAGPGSSGGGPVFQGGTVEQQIVGTLVSSLLGALLSGLNAPPGQDGEAIRKKLQKQWDDEEAARRVYEKKREEELFQKAHLGATAALGSRPPVTAGTATPAPGDGVFIGAGRVPALLRDAGAVSEAQWAEARAWQARIDVLRARSALTAAEAQELAALEARRDALWARAVSVPGLTQRDRDALRLKLHVASTGAVAASMDDVLRARDEAAEDPRKTPVHPLTTLVEASVTSGVKSAIELGGEAGADLIGNLPASKGKKLLEFGDAYALGGVAVAVVKGKPEEAADPAISWTLGKIVAKAPGLGLSVGTAQGTAAVTTTLARRSIENLVEATDSVVPILAPGETGKQWWEARKAELSLPQRFVVEGLGM